jgi:phosphopantothenoylcysteine decarboxylase/phosphopantothenate--cysteine ligase
MVVAAKRKLNIVITAGGTREYIDPVRFISNASSGRMGYALAAAAIKAGHKVTLITAPTALKPPKGAAVVNVVTSDDMFKAVKAQFKKCECLIMAAAVSDYKPAAVSQTKIKKEQAVLRLTLKPTTDILKWAGRNKKAGQILAGFALEDKNLLENAEGKLKRKNLDMIVANSPSAIAAEKSTIHLKTRLSDWLTIDTISKSVSARRIIQRIETLK